MMAISRRVVDFVNGFIYGMGSGIFCFIVGFLAGKIVVYGYSVAWMSS